MKVFGGRKYDSIPTDASWLLSWAEIAEKTPADMLSELNACILGTDDELTMIGAVNPDHTPLRQFVEHHISSNVGWYQITSSDISRIVRSAKVDHKKEVENLLQLSTTDENAISRIVEHIIQFAFKELASDIHIEPQKHNAIVRFRIDGVLHQIFTIPKDQYPAVVARIKILSNLRTDETRHPQDGRFEPEGYDEASLRVSTIPTLYGEKIVMRILDENNAVLTLAALGFSDKQIKIIERNIEKPYGMIVASGPTGSGKTTTLYALLQQLKKDIVNISTLEDPIEYGLNGVNQTQVNTDLGFTFSKGLRSLLRQDPDVILVGEIRDQDTTSMAANASMTGHLVFTSMHTNDAASAFARFIEMGVEEFMVVSTVNLVIAQRLVRKLCPHCTTRSTLPDILQNKIQSREDIVHLLEKSPFNINLKKDSFPRPVGCSECSNTGYFGRTGVYELLEMNESIHDAILSGKSASEIRKTARDVGFNSMLEDGIGKVVSGVTSIEEVMRTTRTN